jgi:hypothetical protein
MPAEMSPTMTIMTLEIVPAVIEVAVPVMVVPIAPQRERYDREANLHPVFRQQDPSPAILEIEIAPGDPAALAAPSDIAPRVARQTAMNVNPRPGGERVDNRKTGARTRAKVQIGGDEARPRHRGRGGGKCGSSRERCHDQILSHFKVLIVWREMLSPTRSGTIEFPRWNVAPEKGIQEAELGLTLC